MAGKENGGVQQELYLAPQENAVVQKETAESKAETEKRIRKNELHKLRTSNRKVFRMSDGTQQAVFYPNAVHALDDETKIFEEVDTAIVADEDKEHYCNGKGNFKARFCCKEDNELFSIERGKYSVTVLAKSNKGKSVKPVFKKNADNNTDIVFKRAHNGAHYKYNVMADGVKENIIVNKKANTYKFPFVLHCRNVTAQLDEENKRVAFLDTENGEEVFYIPSPVMSDANKDTSCAVDYELKQLESGEIEFTVKADSEWMNNPFRAFPVEIDPQIAVSNSGYMSIYNWTNSVMTQATSYAVGLVTDVCSINHEHRVYLKLTKPQLPKNPRIKKAELVFNITSGNNSLTDNTLKKKVKVGLYKVTGKINTGSCNPAYDANVIDYVNIPESISSGSKLSFDVTQIIEKMYNDGDGEAKLMVKFATSINAGTVLYLSGNGAGSNAPTLNIDYESSYGVNDKYRTHTHELGRFGQGSIDLACGNLMFSSEDLSFAGNRMPVTIKHLYNSALAGEQYTSSATLSTANFTSMKIGNGFKLNIMQSMVYNANLDKYILINADGSEAYFKRGNNTVNCNSDTQCYALFEEENENSISLYDDRERILTIDKEKYLFDSYGRLVKATDEYGNHMDIVYDANNRIKTVTDGAGRVFAFDFSETCGYLHGITAPDGNIISYTYNGDYLSSITYPDGRRAEITYSDNKPLSVVLYDADNTIVHKVQYTFNNDRVASITEYGVDNGTFVLGTSTSYSYSAAANSTSATITETLDAAYCETKTTYAVYTFDENCELAGEYAYGVDGNKKAVTGGSGINPYDAETKAQSNIDNLLVDHGFKRFTTNSTTYEWKRKEAYSGMLRINKSNYGHFEDYSLHIDTGNAICQEHGIYQSATLSAGEYTFSAYVKILKQFDCIENARVFLRIIDENGTALAESDDIREQSSFVRLIAPFKLDAAQTVQVQLLLVGAGELYINSPQLENNGFANRYNLVENGNFENGITGWGGIANGHISTAQSFNMSRSLCLTGDINSTKTATQTIEVSDSLYSRNTYTLSGWAKGFGLPAADKTGDAIPAFNITATIVYGNGEKEPHTASFRPCTSEWQPVSLQFTKEKYNSTSSIVISCNYNYNVGTAYFDNISLFLDSTENGVSEADFVSAEVQGEPTETAEQKAPAEFKEMMDAFGNVLTETDFTDGEFGTMYRSFGYNAKNGTMNNAGNDLVKETDTRGNSTQYIVDPETSRNQEVIDRLLNKTAYEYDEGGRTTKVTSLAAQKDSNGKTIKDAENNILYDELANVSYAYDAYDNLTEITRGDGMKYALKYNEFHKLKSIGIDGKTDGDLVTYSYKNGSGRVNEIAYANGYKMQPVYNDDGRLVAEKWGRTDGNATVCYRYVYDNNGNLVRSIDIQQKKEYNYIYEKDKIVRTVEYDITLDSAQNVTSKTAVCNIEYTYDDEDRVIYKKEQTKDDLVEYFTDYPENSNPVVTVCFNGLQVICHSKNDHFGRKEFDELQISTGTIFRKYSYHQGKIPSNSSAYNKVKSAPTTNLVSRIEMSDGRTLEYEYDAEERITKVTDSVDGVTENTYDAQGQLLSERHKAVDAEEFTVVNEMTYDNYGNILTKNGIQYVYDGVWKDRLASYNGQTIYYDAQGNITYNNNNNDYFWWGKGRQLKRMEKWQADGNLYLYEFTYNANGIRTSKTAGTVRHDYMLDGTRILKETWGNNVLIPLYDNEDSVCGAYYNGYAYYFQKNLQGDVIAVYDQNDYLVARYSYDAWGKVSKTVYPSACSEFGEINPFLYRGYYYDWETGLYYLQSRYYDPEMGRFINADEPEIAILEHNVLGHNLFAYCGNEPIIYIDENGDIRKLVINTKKKTKLYGTILTTSQFAHESLLISINLANISIYMDIIKTDNAKSFINAWNGLSKKDLVIVNCHGNPRSMNGVSIKKTEKLLKQRIKLLILLACNVGHYDYKKSSICFL